jgi:hypothetical protein
VGLTPYFANFVIFILVDTCNRFISLQLHSKGYEHVTKEKDSAMEFCEVLMYLSSEMRVREAIREYAERMSF